MKRATLNRAGFLLFLAAAAYVAVATLTWALRHPELTQTQNLLHILDALLWREPGR